MAPSPDPDLPEEPSAPYTHGRDLVPIRRNPRRIPNARLERLFTEEDQLRDEIRDVDQQLLDLTARRQHLLERTRRVHNEIRPVHYAWCGRRRRHVADEEPLPPTAEHPTLLIGRELRAMCLVFLRQAKRALSLRALHAQLHRAGYAIAHAHPVKALADAIGHEADANRCTRVRRGVYAPPPPAPGSDGYEPAVALPDW
jgi:hypothetical protein